MLCIPSCVPHLPIHALHAIHPAASPFIRPQVQFPPAPRPCSAKGGGAKKKGAGAGAPGAAAGGEVRPCLVPLVSLLNHDPWPHIVHFSRVDPATGCLRWGARLCCRAGDLCADSAELSRSLVLYIDCMKLTLR